MAASPLTLADHAEAMPRQRVAEHAEPRRDG
jgi:hypothetical protein